jgi:phosphoglycerol transferase MdoB-like AlkP superfamily enzyme
MTSQRFRLAAFAPLVMIAVGIVSRPILYVAFHDGAFSATVLAKAMLAGMGYDALVGVIVATPLSLALATLRLRVLERPGARFAVFTVVAALTAFGAFIEWFFFEEFNSRFNNIAIDYIRSPKEVLGNIQESYHAGTFGLVALSLGMLAAWAGLRATRGISMEPMTWRLRLRSGGAVLGAMALASAALAIVPADVDRDRIVSEIAQNGIDRLVHAARTGSLEYSVYYRTLPDVLARKRAATVLEAAWIRDDADPVTALPDVSPRPWDVVVILEESFGSEFVGALGHPERKTSPGFDRWSREGLLLTNLTSTGNRTVRGLEGTLCSLVPLPGAAVLKKMSREPVATLADVFRADGYKTAFVYGGWGRFDDMKPFFPTNGFDEFIERDSYPDDAFSTIWGVADEWILGQALKRQQLAHERGERLFMTVLTVSNHRPYRVPERGTAWPAQKQSRESAVAYADWALADYLDKAKTAGLLDHTLVLIEGDHGARVYGSQEIPTPSYRIPGLFLVPDPSWKGRRIDRLASQIDLAPTLLALTGRRAPTPFLGEDITTLPADGGRAFVQHDRDVGLLTDHALVTLGLQRKDVCYTRSGRDSDVFTRATSCSATPELQGLEDDAAAVFQTADSMLQGGTFVLPTSIGIAALCCPEANGEGEPGIR